MEIDVECWLFFFYVHPYARMGTLRRSVAGAGAGQNPDPNPYRNPAPPGLPTPYVALRFW